MSHADRSGDVPQSGTASFARSFDSAEPPSEAVVDAVAAVTGERPVDLPPLYHAVDPDALDAVFEGRERRPGTTVRRITFEYADLEISVRGDRQVRIRDPAPSSRF